MKTKYFESKLKFTFLNKKPKLKMNSNKQFICLITKI